MALEIKGLDELIAGITRIEERTNKGSLREMRRVAAEMRNLARQNAPVDTHQLTDHIVAKEHAEGSHRRKAVEVGVFSDTTDDLEGRGHPLFVFRVEGDDEPVHDIDSYAMEVHEHLAPHGTGQYGTAGGPNSKSGPKIDAGYDVGGRFIERAFEEVEGEFISSVSKAVKEAL